MAGNIFSRILNTSIKFIQTKRTNFSQWVAWEVLSYILFFETLSFGPPCVVDMGHFLLSMAWVMIATQVGRRPWQLAGPLANCLLLISFQAKWNEGDQVVNYAVVCCTPEIQNMCKRSNISEDSRTQVNCVLSNSNWPRSLWLRKLVSLPLMKNIDYAWEQRS
jgi:hypothetical protein